MTTEEIRQKSLELEQQILALVEKFEQDTTCRIFDIKIKKVLNLTNYVNDITVRVEV